MGTSQFNLNLLVALDALLTEKNVTHAGARIHLSQSAMSGALNRLREFFDDQLLVQVGRNMTLTPLAEDLAGPVRDILLQIRATMSTRPNFDPAKSTRKFALALSDYVTAVYMQNVLQRVQETAPGVTFELHSMGDRSVEALENGTLDFLIAPEAYLAPNHPKEPLFADTHVCIAWASNKKIGKTLSLRQYLSMGHVIVHAFQGSTPSYDEWFLKRFKYQRRVEVVTQSFDAAPQLIVGTNRVATVGSRLAKKYAAFLPLKVIPLPVEIPPMVEFLQWHKSRSQVPSYLWLRDVLKEKKNTAPTTSSNSEQTH
jgi:LysR family transcriptional regulator, nod-box dependent transcriptional activator